MHSQTAFPQQWRGRVAVFVCMQGQKDKKKCNDFLCLGPNSFYHTHCNNTKLLNKGNIHINPDPTQCFVLICLLQQPNYALKAKKTQFSKKTLGRKNK